MFLGAVVGSFLVVNVGGTAVVAVGTVALGGMALFAATRSGGR
jgi:hypothetical protein